MSRHSTERKVFQIQDPSIKAYFGDNETATTEYMKKIKSELVNKPSRDGNDEKVIQWIDAEFEQITAPEDAKKKIGMETEAPGTKASTDGMRNNHFKERKKANDKDADPTRVRMAKITGNSRNIMSNSATYESIDKEIDAAKYLIEYMNKTNKTI